MTTIFDMDGEKDGYAVRAILPRPERRGLPRTGSTNSIPIRKRLLLAWGLVAEEDRHCDVPIGDLATMAELQPASVVVRRTDLARAVSAVPGAEISINS
jgi:hypothetical protein